LREDFHYTAYSTISYIQKGPKSPEDDEIEFQPARVFELPPIKDIKHYLESLPRSLEVPDSKPKPKRRRIRDSAASEDDDSPNKFSKSVSNAELEELIERKVEFKLRRLFVGNDEPSTSADSNTPDDIVV
jgi:hypothetical protein